MRGIHTQREEKFHFDNDVVVNAMCKHKIILERKDKRKTIIAAADEKLQFSSE